MYPIADKCTIVNNVESYNPQKSGEAVGFINNCVAVVDNNQELAALWLQPQALPEW